MKPASINDKRVMHIDTSGKLHERRTTGISYKIIGSDQHKGLALSIKLKKELKRDLQIEKDFAKVYAICIYYLIKDCMNEFDVLVICADENFKSVKGFLDILFKNQKEYLKKEILSLYKLRKITGDKSLKSYADGVARSYRKRGLKNYSRRQKGTPLNVVEVNYKKIKEKWLEIERLKCK